MSASGQESQRVLAFRHVPFEGAGLIEPELSRRGLHLDYADLYAPHSTEPSLSSYRALIFLGGPMSVNDDLEWLRREEAYIREAAQYGTPVLGVCLGAQLIAKALGATVHRNPIKEIGWFEIETTPAGRQDPLFASLAARESVFHWHGETFDLPPCAELLASSARCRNQAFRVGSSTYGLQFHLEVSPEMIADWCSQDENCGDVRELDSPIDPNRHSARLSQLASQFFGKWCDTVRDSQRRW
jgi:GMP synthase-like glutamine amidotransferase